MASGRPEGNAPGLKVRRDKRGNILRRAWMPTQAALDLGYEPAYVRLHDEDDAGIASRCRLLQADMLEWLAQKRGASNPATGVRLISDLIKQYTTRDASPYQRVKWNTKRTYRYVLNDMDRVIGQVRLADIRIDDIVRWFNDARYPEGKGRDKPDHLRTAAGIVAMLRRLVAFGVAIEVRECERLSTILSNYRFEAPKKRTAALEHKHVLAFIAEAVARGEHSLALGTALQFETTLRQRDVIGEWEPIGPDGATSAYVLGGVQWANGLTWSHISPNWTLTKSTTKSGGRKNVTFDLALMPLAFDLLQDIPEDARFGPLIIDQKVGRPFAETRYQRRWRAIANDAGLPREVWNMDARAGGATEADEAGADPRDVQRTMTHSDMRTTSGYRRGEALPQTRRVATLRVAHRAQKDKMGGCG
jgi:hypothetical protein